MTIEFVGTSPDLLPLRGERSDTDAEMRRKGLRRTRDRRDGRGAPELRIGMWGHLSEPVNRALTDEGRKNSGFLEKVHKTISDSRLCHLLDPGGPPDRSAAPRHVSRPAAPTATHTLPGPGPGDRFSHPERGPVRYRRRAGRSPPVISRISTSRVPVTSSPGRVPAAVKRTSPERKR